MGYLYAVLLIVGFILTVCCVIIAVSGKTCSKLWYVTMAAYIFYGVCASVALKDWRQIGVGFLFVCACYFAKIAWNALKAKIKHEKYSAKTDIAIFAAALVLFIVGMMLPYDKAAEAQRTAEAEARAFEKAASSAAAASSKAEVERQKQAESEAAASRDAESKRLKEEAESKAASDSKKAEEERNAAIRAESEKQAASSKSSSKSKKSSSSTSEQAVTTIDFNAVYKEYKSNEVRAEETYGDKRYRVTGTVNALTDGGLANLFGGTTVTLVRQVGNTTVYFFASFSKDQKDAIMKINTGDEITFVGEYSKMSFYSCELESYTRDGKTVKVY